MGRGSATAKRLAVSALALLAGAGCADVVETPNATSQSGSSGSGGLCGSTPMFERLSQPAVGSLDLLFVIDNSRGMADKQQLLAAALPELLGPLLDPVCVDQDHQVVAQPPSPLEPCPPGSQRVSSPLLDVHVGVITSSLGGHGADACSTAQPGTETQNDAGHLISRLDAASPSGSVATYQGLGFLAWDPAQELAPPGEPSLGGLTTSLVDLVGGAGQIGCGYESQLESWLRFLVDPAPYESIVAQASSAVKQGVDSVLLKQRADFLRPDSALGIVLLTDEDDCSMREGGPYYYGAQLVQDGMPFHLPRARQACAANPDDVCCFSCASPDVGNCIKKADDVECQKGPYSASDDPPNLRCWDQKRRFGIDFLYPTARYVNALTQASLDPEAPDLALTDMHPSVPNPIFSDLDPSDDRTAIRDPRTVFLAALVGVPWQDVARDPHDAAAGLQTAEELAHDGPSGTTAWQVILGDPAAHVPPLDPLMHASIAPRTGTNPVLGAPLAQPGSAPDANPINGHERSIPQKDDLQYTCVFDLETPRDCTDPTQPACDCTDPNNDSPVCDPLQPTTQTRAKAYPGLRELEVVKGLGAQGVVGSVCAPQTADPAAPDYGYRQAVRAIVQRVGRSLDTCFVRTLKPDASGHVPCVVLEATAGDGACNCDAPGRAPLSADEACLHDAALAEAPGAGCLCAVRQLDGDDLAACLSSPDASAPGFCYVDPAAGQGDPAIVAACPAEDKRLVRVVGGAAPGATLLVTCSG